MKSTTVYKWISVLFIVLCANLVFIPSVGADTIAIGNSPLLRPIIEGGALKVGINPSCLKMNKMRR